jgi:hypothetical protein
LDPYLKQELPFDIETLLVAPISHLQEAIAWCHRRQVFVQLEERAYISLHTPVNLNKLLDSVSASGTVFSEDDAPLALDETVLRIALDEVVANALKYRKEDTPIRMFAHYTAGMLRLEVQNINPDGFRPLTAEECRRVFDSEFKMRHCSAMSDGLGLDSVALAVDAAGGSVSLESSSEATLVRISLPATLCQPQAADPSSSPDRSVSAPSGARARTGQPIRPPALHPGNKKSTTKRSSPLKQADRTGWHGRPCTGPSISLSQLRQPLAGFGENVERCESEQRSHDSPLPHCIGLSDARNQAAIASLFSDCLKAEGDVCVLRATQQELTGFVERVIGHVDIVVISVAMSDVDEPGVPLLGTDVAQRLRRGGYLGVICIFGTEMTDEEREDLSAHPAVDLLIQQGKGVEGASNAMNRYRALRGGSSGTRSAEFSAADTEECMEEDQDWQANASLGGSPFGITPRTFVSELVTARAGRISIEKDNEHRPHPSRPVKLTPFVRPRPPAPNGHMQPAMPPNPTHAKCQPASPSATIASGRSSPPFYITRPGPMPPNIRPGSTTPDSPDGKGCTWSPPQSRPEPSAASLVRPTQLLPTARVLPSSRLPSDGQTSPIPDSNTLSHTQCTLGPQAAADSLSQRNSVDRLAKPQPDSAQPVLPLPSLRVIGLDDESIPRMIQAMFIKHHLKADPEISCALGKTAQEIGAFIDVVLGRLHPDLTVNHGVQRHADIVLLDENIAPPTVLGSILAARLAEGGFRGVTVLLTGTSAVHLAQLRASPHVDLAYEKGFPLQRLAEEIKAALANKQILARCS